jgi:hypothetical protein
MFFQYSFNVLFKILDPAWSVKVTTLEQPFIYLMKSYKSNLDHNE